MSFNALSLTATNKSNMAGRGGRPKGGAAIKDNGDKTLPQINGHSESEEPEPSDNGNILGAINDALVSNMHNLGTWLNEIGIEDPVKAMSLYLQLAEYKLPKQQRTDSKQDSASPIVINFLKSSEATIKMETPRIETPKQQPVQPKPVTKTFDINDILPRTRK